MKNEVKINKSKVKILYLKNKNVDVKEFMLVLNDIDLYEKVYFISFYDNLKQKIFDYYDQKIKEDGKNYIYSDLFIYISLCVSLNKYDYIKDTYDRLDKSGDKAIISINYSIIEYYLFFSDYKSILKLLYALSMCKKFKKYILKHTLKYLKYMTDVDDELIKKLLRNFLDKDLYFSFRIYRAVTDNLNISLKEGISRYYGMSYEEFEDLAYRRVFENKFLFLVSEIYKDKYNATIEDFYNNIDSVFKKIESYEENKELLNDTYKYIQREFLLFIILSDFSKYDKYKNDLFDILKSDLFRPSYVYHSIDTIDKLAIENGRIIELLDNMPNNIYGYSENIINNSYYYRYCKHEYLEHNYKNIFNYLNKYTPEEIIRIYMNTSMKLVISFDEIIKYIKNNYNVDIDISNYYFFGTISLNFMHKYELKVTNVLFKNVFDVTDNVVINNLYSYYLDNVFNIRFKFNSNLEISNIEYISKEGSIISFYDRYKNVYESACLGLSKSEQISYINKSSNYNLPIQIYEIHLNGILKIDETNFNEVKRVLENDNISGFCINNYDIVISDLKEKYSYSESLVIDKWDNILKMNFSSIDKFIIYINSAFKLFIKLEDVLNELSLKEIPNYEKLSFLGVSTNKKLKIKNVFSDKILDCDYDGKIMFKIKDSSFKIVESSNQKKGLEGLELISYEIKNNSFSDEVILKVEDLLTFVDDERYVKHVNYLECLVESFSKYNTKDQLISFISNIGKNNIFNENYSIYYPIYLIISNFGIDLYEKIIHFDMSLEEAIHIYLNSPLKYMYLISDYLKDYFKINKANCASVDFSSHELILECFILEKKDSYLVEYNNSNFNIYLESAPDFGFVKVKLTRYEVFTGKLFGKVINNEIDKIDIKSEYDKAFNKMKNFKIGDDYNNFNYLYTYKASTFNINDYIEEYQKIVSDNFRDLDYLYEFLRKNNSFNIFNSSNDYGELKYNRYIKFLKEKFDGLFRFGDYNESILEKKIYISENSFIKNPLRRLIRTYLRKVEMDKFEFKDSKRLKLKVSEIGNFITGYDEYRNHYPLKFSIDYNLKVNNYIIVDLLEYDYEGNYFKASLVSIFNEENYTSRRFALHINDILDILTNILYDDGENISYYLESLSKYSNEDVLFLNILCKKREFLSLYMKLFKKYIGNFDILNRILICLEKLNPYDLFNCNYKSEFFDKKELLDIVSLYIDNIEKTDYYLESLNIYFNSFISKYISLKKLREIILTNKNGKFNASRNSKTLFIKYKADDIFYLKSYCNKLKFPIEKPKSKKPFLFFKIKKRDIEGGIIRAEYMKSYKNLEEIRDLKL